MLMVLTKTHPSCTISERNCESTITTIMLKKQLFTIKVKIQ